MSTLHWHAVVARSRRVPAPGTRGYKPSSRLRLHTGSKLSSSSISTASFDDDDDPAPNLFYLHRLLTAVAGTFYPELGGIKRGKAKKIFSELSLSSPIFSEYNSQLKVVLERQAEEGVDGGEEHRQRFQSPKPAPPISMTSDTVPSAALLKGASLVPTAQGLQPHIIALIDGDGYIPKRDILREGRRGGLKAARLIAEAVSEKFDRRLDYRLSIYLLMNERGLFKMLMETDRHRNPLSRSTLKEFMYGFQVPPFNYVIGIGPGKEYVDTKVKELLRVSLRSPDTETVILGVLNDSGYINSIEGEVLFQDKITLLHVPSGLRLYETRFPHLRTITVPGLFEDLGEFDRAEDTTEHAQVAVTSRGKAREPRTRSPSEWDTIRAHASSAVYSSTGKNVDGQGEQELEEDGPHSATGLVSSTHPVPPSRRTRRRRRLDEAQNGSDGSLQDSNTTRQASPARRTKDPKDRRARPGPGATARTVFKNAWIQQNPRGTEGEFQAYWEAKGQKAYQAQGWSYLNDIRKRMDAKASSSHEPPKQP